MAQKVSEIVMDDDTLGTFGLSREALEQEVTLTGFGTDLVSVHISQQEIERQTLSAHSVDVLSERMERWGVVALQGVLSKKESLALAEHIYQEVQSPTYAFGGIMEPELRKDYPLEMFDWNTRYYEKVSTFLFPLLNKMLGEDAELVEYSSIVSFPGAGQQNMHPDAGMEQLNDLKTWAKVYSIFVYLDDVDPDMAALDVRPGTHTHFHFLIPEEASMLGSVPQVRMAVPSGSIVIMDSRCHHRGSANNSTKKRPVFYFSLKSKHGVPPMGPTYSLRQQYINKFTLQGAAVEGNTLRIGQAIKQGSRRGSSSGSSSSSSGSSSSSSSSSARKKRRKKNNKANSNAPAHQHKPDKNVGKTVDGGNEKNSNTAPAPTTTTTTTITTTTTAVATPNTTQSAPSTVTNWPLPIGLDHTYDFNDTSVHDYSLVSPLPPKYEGIMPASAIMPPPIVTVDTLEWKSFVKESNIALICFYDPRSASYAVLKDIYPKAALALQDIAVIGAVNTAKDSYLTSNMAWEMDLANQNPFRDEAFTFGKPNYYPMIVHLYKNGTKIVEYTGVQSAEAISKWVRQMAQSSAGSSAVKTIQNQEEFYAFTKKSNDFPMVVGCFNDMDVAKALLLPSRKVRNEIYEEEFHKKEKQNHEENKQTGGAAATTVTSNVPNVTVKSYNRTHDYKAFSELAEISSGDYIFVRVNQQELCTRVLGVNSTYGTATLVFNSVYSVFTFPIVTTIDVSAREDLLSHFVEAHSKSIVVGELTPDNSHTFLDQAEPVLLILCHPLEPKQNHKAKEIAQQLSVHVGVGKLLLSWANGPEFSSQFNIENNKKRFPAFLLLSKIESESRSKLSKSKQKKHDAITGRLSDEYVEFPTYVYESSQFGKPNFVHFNKWMNKTGVIDAFDKYNKERLNVYYNNTVPQGSQGEGSGASGNGTNTSTTNSSLTNSTQQIIDDPTAPQIATDEQFITMTNTTNATNSTNHTNNTNNTLGARRVGQGEGPLDPLSAMRRMYANLMKLGTYERLVARKKRGGLKNMSKTDKIMSKSVRKIRRYMKKHHSNIAAPISTPADMEHKANDDKEWVALKRSVEKLDKTKMNMMKIENVTKSYDLHKNDATYMKDVYNVAVSYVKADMYLMKALSVLVKDLEKAYVKELGREVNEQDLEFVEIDVVHWKNLSMRKFMRKYATHSMPVVIRGLPITRTPWTFDHIKKHCGNATALLKQRRVNSTDWGGLEPAEVLRINDFIDTFRTNETRQKYYLHDWSLPRDCPEIMGKPPYEEFLMPRYFAGDYFQRVFPNGYQHTWPSLFIGANGTQSDMHVDSGGTNFWLYLLSGKKEWRFYAQDDAINLYGIPETSKYNVDPFEPNVRDYPLMARAKMYKTTQLPGDLVFIPGGCPHAVQNLDHIHGLSMNYVDSSNYYLHLWTRLLEFDFRDFEL